jgi:hypothetical protein
MTTILLTALASSLALALAVVLAFRVLTLVASNQDDE